MASDLHIEQVENVITLTKDYDTTKGVLFSMFSNPEQLTKWWGPGNWPAGSVSFDFREGGVWHYFMTGPDDAKVWGKATFQEIDVPNSLSFTDAFSDADGTVDDSLPVGYTTFRFVEENAGVTTLTMTSRYDTVEQANEVVKMGMLEGMKDTWTQLEQLVKNRSVTL